MDTSLSPDHPRLPLYFYVLETPSNDVLVALSKMIDELASKREWVIGPPEPAFEVDGDMPTEDRDAGLPTGGVLQLYSAFPPHIVPLDVDRQQLKEVEALVAAVWELSERHHATFEFMWQREVVGEVADGVIDRTLRVNFLDEWRKALEAEERTHSGEGIG